MNESLDNPKPQPEDHWHPEAVAWFRWAVENYVGDADFYCGLKMAAERCSRFWHCADFLNENGSDYMEAGKRRTYAQDARLDREHKAWLAARRELCLDQAADEAPRKPHIAGRYS